MMLDFSVVVPYAGLLATGAAWTLLITVLAGAISIGLGLALALVVLYGPRAVSIPLRGVAFLFMATPLLLQLYLLYYGLSQVGILIPAFWTGVVGLGIHFAVYNAEIFRASLQAVDPGQMEAARALGFGRKYALYRFIVPQSVLTSLPQVGNNSLILLKDTAILSVLGIAELVLNAQRGISATYRPFEFYFAVAVLYYILNMMMEWGLRRASRKVEAIR